MKTFYAILIMLVMPLCGLLIGQTEKGLNKPMSFLKKTTENNNRSLPDWRPWQEIYYNWNSISETWDLFTNTDFSYSGGHLAQSMIDYPDGSQPLQRVSYTYDEGGNETEEITEIFDGSQYVNQTKHVTLFASNSYETGYEIWQWQSNNWVLTEGDRRVDMYNSDNKLTVASFQSYDYSNLLWVTYYETVLGYDSNHKLVEIINRNINGMPNILENYQKFQLKYSSFSVNPDSVYLYSWDGSEWILSQRAIDIEWPGNFIPIIEDEPLSYLLQNDETGVWMDEERMSTTISPNFYIQLTEHHINSLWTPFYRITREYDDWGNITLDNYEYYQNNSWLIVYKDVYSNTYDAADRLFEVIGLSWNNSSNILEYNFKRQFLDYGDISGIQEMKNDSEQLFPNPATTFLNVNKLGIQFSSFDIIDIKGNIVNSGSINDDNAQIDVSILTSGLYFVRLNNSQRSIIRSFVKN
jgi:hypothetical protein